MVLSVLATLAFAAFTPADTVIMLGSREIDMTGDGRAETLQLVAAGPSVDSLSITFSILSTFDLLYAVELHPFGFDGPQAKLTSNERMERLSRFSAAFFDDRKFTTPAGFLAGLDKQAPGRIEEIPRVMARDRAEASSVGRSASDTTGVGAIWRDIQQGGLPVFEFLTGGDASTAIGWSRTERRFYRLFQCC